MKNKLLLLLMLAFTLSCTKDEKPTNLPDNTYTTDFVNEAKWSLDITRKTATTVKYTLDSVSGFSDVKLVCRMKGDKNGPQFDIPLGTNNGEIDRLIPNTEYEFLVYNKITGKVSDKSVSFTTMAFDAFINDYGNDTRYFLSGGYATSEGEVNSWKLENVATNIDDISVQLVSVKDSTRIIDMEDVRITSNSLYFTISDDAIPQDPYESGHDFKIQYSVNGKKYKFITGAGSNNFTNDEFIEPILWVGNKAIGIESGYAQIRENGLCNGDKSMYFVFSGGYPEDVKSENVTAVMTRLSDDKLTIYQPVGDFYDCIMFVRLNNSDYNVERMSLRQPLEYYPFGDYKIKFTFSKNGEYYETNEFHFTVPKEE